MKKSNPLFIIYLSILICGIACTTSWNNHHLNIKAIENKDYYQFYAKYNKHKTNKVEYFINNNIAPNIAFASSHDYLNTDIELKNGTKFYIKSTDGYLKIKFNKNENSDSAYQRIKSMCIGIKNILTDK